MIICPKWCSRIGAIYLCELPTSRKRITWIMDTWISGLKNSGDWAAHITVNMICNINWLYLFIYIYIYIYVCFSASTIYSTTWIVDSNLDSFAPRHGGVVSGLGVDLIHANSIWLDWTIGEIILYMYTYLYDLCIHIYIIHYNSIYLWFYIYIYISTVSSDKLWIHSYLFWMVFSLLTHISISMR